MDTTDAAQRRAEIDAAPNWALFDEEYVAAVRGLSVFTIQAERRRSTGVPYVRQGRRVLYRKQDIMDFLSGLTRFGPPQAIPKHEAAA